MVTNSCIVNQRNWRFEIDRTEVLDKAIGKERKVDTLEFPTAIELVDFIVEDDGEDRPIIQRKIEDRIDGDQCVRQWKKNRTLMRDLKHFPQYRNRKYDLYHAAARASSKGTATRKQHELTNGLTSEINASQIKVNCGQILFHGRADDLVTSLEIYPTFISTSLDPVVAHQSAVRRAQEHLTPIIYILTSRISLPVIWGQTPSSFEYEVLLPRNLSCLKKSEKSIGKFKIIEADIVGHH